MSDNGLTWRHVDRTDRQLEDSGQKYSTEGAGIAANFQSTG